MFVSLVPLIVSTGRAPLSMASANTSVPARTSGGGKTTPKPKPCGAAKYKGDGVCDDNNNHKGCDYDGGDCCAKNANFKYCKKVFLDCADCL